MPTPTVLIQLLGNAKLPQYATSGAAAFDLTAAKALTLAPGQCGSMPTGLKMAIPEGYEGQIRPRSGLAANHGITVLNAPGTIDSDYRGEIIVLLVNHGSHAYSFSAGDRVAQMVIASVEQATLEAVGDLDETARGEGGFGSTGK